MKRRTLPDFWRTAFIVVTVLVAACGQKAPTTSASAGTTSQQFPGYQQVGQSGDAAQLWFNPGDIPRHGQIYDIHTLKTFPGGGYARFDMLTNCRDTTQRMAGTQYRSDGTADKAYPGNDTAVAAQSEPGMGQLMEAACTVAMASRAIPGDFNVPAALELLYGPYDEQAKTATWTDAAVPKDLPWAQNLSFSPGDTLYVSGIATFDFNEGGTQKKILVTNARKSSEDGGDGHASTGLLGISTFVKDGTSWKVEASEPYVASLGEWGNVGDRLSWVAAGDSSYALVVHNGDAPQGFQYAATDVFVRDPAGKFHHVISDSDTGVSDQEGVKVDSAFLKGRDPQHYGVKISFTYTMPGQKTYVADHLYEYANGKYVLVRKDDPPKFNQLADPTETSVSPPVSGAMSAASSEQVSVVSLFYAALAKGDGASASALVIPEKRGVGPFSELEISRFYGSLQIPLVVENIRQAGENTVTVRYQYSKDSSRSCVGNALVTTTNKYGTTLIEKIAANC